jgi:hypothetical protein
MLVQPASDPPVLGRERDEAGEERSLRSWAGFAGILPSGGVFTAVGGWVPSGAPSPSVGMRLAWWSCARRRASLGECVYGRADSVPPREGSQVGEDGAQRCVEDRIQRKGALRGDDLKLLCGGWPSGRPRRRGGDDSSRRFRHGSAGRPSGSSVVSGPEAAYGREVGLASQVFGPVPPAQFRDGAAGPWLRFGASASKPDLGVKSGGKPHRGRCGADFRVRV